MGTFLKPPCLFLCIYLSGFVKNNSLGKGGYDMFEVIKENIRGFTDATVLMTMIAIGIFEILSDYRYFKRVKFRKDSAVSLGLGISFILLPFVFFFIIRL